MARIREILLLAALAGVLCAQPAAQTERLTRIEDATIGLKSTVEKADKTLEEVQKELRALQDKVIAVESQNRIIVTIAALAFTIGLSFLVWLYKKFEASAQQSFTARDRDLLEKIYQRIPERSSTASGQQ